MMILMYMIPLCAWIAFIYHMHHTGGRPTTHRWWALMTGLGVFELGKGIASLTVPSASVVLGFGAAVLAAGTVLTMHTRRTWTAGALERDSLAAGTR